MLQPMRNRKVDMKYLFAFISPMHRVWHRTGTQEMLEQEGSKGRDEDNDPRTRGLFASCFTISEGTLRGSQKAASTSLPPPWASVFLHTKYVGGGGQGVCTEKMLD